MVEIEKMMVHDCSERIYRETSLLIERSYSFQPTSLVHSLINQYGPGS